MLNFTPFKWYWIVGGDQTQAFSSAANAYVPVADETYVAWLSVGNVPTTIDTLDNLKAVLRDAGVPPYKPITQLQARKTLRQAGLIDAVNTAVAGSSPEIQDAWNYASIILRTDPMIIAIGTQLNLTDADINNLFILAATL